MSQTLYHYYERELTFIRQFAQEFARQYPAAAGRLLLEPNRSTDPHVERLIESFALLTGRIQHKLDDEFPELTTALLGVLYPHYLAPIPSMAVVQFELDAAAVALARGLRDRPAQPPEHPAGGRPALPVSHRLSGEALADQGGGRPAGSPPIPARDQPAPRGGGGPADPARVPGRSEIRRTRPRRPALLPEGGGRDGRDCSMSCCSTTRSRSSSAIPAARRASRR